MKESPCLVKAGKRSFKKSIKQGSLGGIGRKDDNADKLLPQPQSRAQKRSGALLPDVWRGRE